MSGFLEKGPWGDQLRDIVIISYCLTAFVLIWFVKGDSNIQNPSVNILFCIGSIFFLIIFSWLMYDLYIYWQTFDGFVYLFCIMIFGLSVIIAAILQDVNVIVASATLLLVIVSAFTIKKTTDIAKEQMHLSLRQMKQQNDPLMSLSLKENDVDVHVIDLVIENAGNGLARNITFEINPPGFLTLSGDPLDRLYFFERGIQLMPAKQKYVIHLVNHAQHIHNIRARHHIPESDENLTPNEALRFRLIARAESELRIKVRFENIDGEHMESIFDFNLCIFWGLRFPQQQHGYIVTPR